MVLGENAVQVPHALAVPNLADWEGTMVDETPEIRKESIQRLQKLLKGDTLLKEPQDEKVLMMFLRSRKYDVKSTFRTMKNYFRARRDIPELFRNLTPANIPYKTVCTDHRLMMVSKEKDHLGRSVGLLRIGAWKSSICSLTDLTRCLLVLTESHLTEEETQIKGFVSVFDMEGLSPYHLAHLTPRYFMKILHVLQDCLPLRTEKIYVVNNPSIFALLFAVAKPFLHRKLLSRIELLGYNFSKLLAVVPTDIIPKRHGGTLEDFDYHSQEAFIERRSAYFEQMDRCGY
ncbi:alpha-tocopherol transfer protein-like isoform X2 [Dermacentor silvarum]|nr:alpha-tocopherol transfer protein-like isoform X2 [Dermacentor silvarum]XP_049521629.1 alpha-tocopherol transfer protein-like isoform X2 [Dermacentor silvarum]